MMKQPNSELSQEDILRVVSSPHEKTVAAIAQDFHSAIPLGGDDMLTVEDARIAVEAIQRLNAKLEMENASLKERVDLLDQLVVRLLKRNDKLANKQ